MQQIGVVEGDKAHLSLASDPMHGCFSSDAPDSTACLCVSPLRRQGEREVIANPNNKNGLRVNGLDSYTQVQVSCSNSAAREIPVCQCQTTQPLSQVGSQVQKPTDPGLAF